eukprot:9221931-Ditylum_brightwellii.AAC.1
MNPVNVLKVRHGGRSHSQRGYATCIRKATNTEVCGHGCHVHVVLYKREVGSYPGRITALGN